MKRRMLLIGVVVALFALAFGVYWFEPHKLVVDDKVNEEMPVTVAPVSAPRPELKGEFRSLEHAASGMARVIETDAGRVLRFEDLKVSNGPDLVVILSNAPANSDSWQIWGDDYVSLGELKGNIGSQNYAIPADVDLGKYSNAVVWCRRFSVGFGVASLSAV